MKKILIAVSLVFFLQVRFASALSFNITYDASVTNLTNAAEVENAFATAAEAFSDTYTNVATINLTIYWGPVGPFTGGISLGRSHFFLIGATNYSEITNALFLHRGSAVDSNAVANLPATDPTPGNWFINISEARVLGLFSTNDSTKDGEIGFSTNVSFTFDPNNRSVPGKFDFIGVAQHELSEVMGRCNVGLGSPPNNAYVPYDLFRFTSSGVRSLDVNSTTNAYFSIDDGLTSLKNFYSNRLAGDIQDWKSSGIPDSFDALSSSGHINPMSTVDFMAMDVLGYNGFSLQPPRLYVTKTNGNIQLRFVNSPGVTFTVLATTNIAVRETNWTVLGTASETPLGQFTFTDTTATNGWRFYSVRSP
jgi:hypothetical protein